MAIIDDREIVADFCSESDKLYAELEGILETIDDSPKGASKLLEKFGQVIDRVMGAAKSIQADEIATFCELGKVIGYKSSQVKDLALINIVTAVLFDSLEILKHMNGSLLNKNSYSLKNLSTEAFASRLHWLSGKFKDIERASVAFDDSVLSQDEKQKKTAGRLNQNSIDDLMKSLGL